MDRYGSRIPCPAQEIARVGAERDGRKSKRLEEKIPSVSKSSISV